MTRSTHPFEKEDVMAYLDGELPAERAAGVAAHLEGCADCQALAGELRRVSQQLTAWELEPAPAGLAEKVTSALESSSRRRRATDETKPVIRSLWSGRPLVWRWAIYFGGASAAVLLLAAITIPNLLRSRMAVEHARQAAPLSEPGQYAVGTEGRLQELAAPQPAPAGPMIIRTAALTLVTKDFDGVRGAIEQLLRQQQGHIAQLNTTGQSAAGRTLTATLRVPAEHLDALLAGLKKLGRVVQESQAGEEVSQQYVDLVARLSNARSTEQRLIDVLRQRTGKVKDILEVEREIARVRGEIEQMEAQRKNLDQQVRFATVHLQLTEEYQAELQVTPVSTGTRLWNALVEGDRSAVEAALNLALFLLRYGPSLLFWGLVLYWPVRFAWRRLRAAAQ